MLHVPQNYRRKGQNKAKQFIASVATTLGVELPNSRAALLQYNETVGPVITFSQYSGLKKFYDDLSDLPRNGKMSKITVAIREASKRIFSSDSRLAVSRVAVLLNFGRADDIQEAEVAAAQLRLKGVKLFVVHVGLVREMNSLRKLVSDTENLFHATDVAGLADIVIPIHNKIISESGNYRITQKNMQQQMVICSCLFYSTDCQRTLFVGPFLFHHTRQMDSRF